MIILDLLNNVEQLARSNYEESETASKALRGLHSQVKAIINKLDKPRSQEELQGIAELLLMTISGQCHWVETLGPEMGKVAECVRVQADFLRQNLMPT